MKKAQYFRFISCVISVILCCLAGAAFVDHKAAADEKNTLEDGKQFIDVGIWSI